MSTLKAKSDSLAKPCYPSRVQRKRAGEVGAEVSLPCRSVVKKQLQ